MLLSTRNGANVGSRWHPIVAIVAQITALWAFSEAGGATVAILHLPLPGNVVGMALFFAALAAGLIQERWFVRSGSFLTKHIAFFFIPLVVGIVDYAPLLARSGFAIVVALVTSTVLGIVVTAAIAQRLARTSVA